MKTVRRLYFYAVTLVSLEVVLWGLIGLLRETFSPDTIGGTVERLARALSLILVGVPIFGIHWWASQRNARQDMDEHASGVRAIALYGVLLGTLIPVLQNFLALINRLMLQVFSESTRYAIIGGTQTFSDNLLGMLLNAVVAAYFIYVLLEDWKAIQPKDTFADVRRLYRYIWMIYGLVMVIGGLQQVISYPFYSLSSNMLIGFSDTLPNGLALLIIGIPLWIWTWKTVQDSLSEPTERASLLRLGILYALSLIGVVTVLTASGNILYAILRLILGSKESFQAIADDIRGPLSIGIPLSGVWAYYAYWLKQDLLQVRDAPRRAGLRRLYSYILSAIGLVATFVGLGMLLSFIIDMSLGDALWGSNMRERLAGSLATLFVSLPLWLLTWRPMQAEALGMDDAGDHARRSIVRKVYLYLALFGTVLGTMGTAGTLIYQLLRVVLGAYGSSLVNDFIEPLEMLVLFVIFLVYHWQVLRQDGTQAERVLTSKHAAFPVLVFDSGVNGLSQAILESIQKETPRLPVTLQPIEAGLAADTLKSTKAIVLPGDLAVAPPEALRVWLSQFNGSKLVVPRETPGWIWPGWPKRKESAIAQQAAHAIRQLAEGQEVSATGVSGWMVLVYIMAGIFGFVMLMSLLSFLLDSVF